MGAWPTTPPYTEEKTDRWLRITWAAKHFKISRAALVRWVESGAVESKTTPAGVRYVSEQSLRERLFGSN